MAEFDAPQSRNEAILQNILGADNVLVESQSRIEEILQCILYNEPYSEEAQSRMEELLLCILNGTDTDLVARSRNEAILIAKIKGEEYTKAPQSRIEELLIEWSNVIQSYTGGGLVYNQLVKNGNFADTSNWLTNNTEISAHDNVMTVTITATSAEAIRETITPTTDADLNHTMMAIITARTDYENGTRITVTKNAGSIASNKLIDAQPIDTEWKTISGVGKMDTQLAGNYYATRIAIPNANAIPVGYSFYLKNVMVVDLTAFFGSDTIPNYILSLESQQAGSGVAWFRQYFPDAYYPYNEGTLTVVDKNNYKLFGYKNWVLGDNVLRGVPTFVDGELVWNGDEYRGGVITRKYGIVDLGTLGWAYHPASGVYADFFDANLPNNAKAGGVSSTLNNILCEKYPAVISFDIAKEGADNKVCALAQYTTRFIVCDKDYTDKDTFKTAMNGVYLIYELASPTHEVVSWNKIRTLVRQGKASEVFTVGDQLSVNVDGVPTKWDIIGIDVDTPYDTTKTHSLTLQMHDCYAQYVFDAREALFAFPDGLEAGTYHFTITADSWVSGDVGKTLQFTIANDIPSGGQLCFSSTYNATMVGSAVQIYASPSSTTAQEETTFAEGSDGTDLGEVSNAISGNTNSLARAKLGNNRYTQSAIRQIINSSASPYGWEAKNIWDRPSETTINGFLSRLDADFLAVLGESVQTTALNTVCDGGGSEQTHDKLFLVSRSQVFDTLENNINEGAQYPYYSIEANRVKYLNSAASAWRLRTPVTNYTHSVRTTSNSGALSNSYAQSGGAVAPAVTII